MSLVIKANKEIDSLDDAIKWIVENEIANYVIMDGDITVTDSSNDVVEADDSSNFNCTKETVDNAVVVDNNLNEKETCIMANQFVAGSTSTVNVTIKTLAARLGADPLKVQGLVGVLRDLGVVTEVGKLGTETGKGRSASIFSIPTTLTLNLDPADSVAIPAPKPAKAPKAPKAAPVAEVAPVTTEAAPVATEVAATTAAPVTPTVTAPAVEVPVPAVAPVAPTVTAPVETPVAPVATEKAA